MATIQDVLPYFKSAKRLVVLTGAGMSTESGIPDFRSKQGIYATAPETVLSRQSFFEKPARFYDFLFDHLYFPNAAPNTGHAILAKWEAEGIDIDIVTQNIDGLHQKAGSTRVIEFHGSANSAACCNPKCGKTYTAEALVSRRNERADFYRCDCGGARGLIKPDVVLFGDRGRYMTRKHVDAIQRKTDTADLVLVLGTGLLVYPFAGFVANRNKQVPLVLVNQGPTPFDGDANTYPLRAPIGETLAEIDRSREL